MKMKAILLKVRRDEVSDGMVRGALCVADASPSLNRPHIYTDREELRGDLREVRTWRTLSFARYSETVLPPGLYEIKMRWSHRFRSQRPAIIMGAADEVEEKCIFARPADGDDLPTTPALFWDEPHAEEYITLKERILRRRIVALLKCGCEVWIRLE